MNIGILSFRSDSLEPTYEEQRLLAVLKERGQWGVLIHTVDCCLLSSAGEVQCYWKGEPFPHVDGLIPRARFVDQPDLRLSLLLHLELSGVPTLNPSSGIAIAKNKVLSHAILARAGVAQPLTLAFEESEEWLKHLETWSFPLVLKEPHGTYGGGVHLVNSLCEAKKLSEALFARAGAASHLLAQEFIPAAEGRDTRVFVVGDQVVAAMERRAQPGEFRSNIELGGSGHKVDFSEEIHELALLAVQSLGLGYGGVDILQSKRGPLVLEVNANPGFKTLEEVTQVDVAGAIVDEALARFTRH